MQRIKFLKSHKQYKSGEIVVIDNNEAFGLIDSGLAQITKDMIPDDYKIKALDEVQANGITPIIRTNQSK